MERLQLSNQLRSMFLEHEHLKLHVIPHARENQIVSIDTDSNTVSMRVSSSPQKGKANKEIVTFFKKELKLSIEIVKGEKSRDKIIRML